MLAPPKITKTDEAFAADGVEFVYSHEGIDLEELNELFGKVSHEPALRLRLADASPYARFHVCCAIA